MGALDEELYFSIKSLAAHTGWSITTIERYMVDPQNPLPSHHVHTTGRDRGRVLIIKREFDAWVAQFPARRGKPAKAALVNDAAAIVRSIRGR